MALSKLVIGLIAGIGSVAAIGGITAGVVVSRNNTVDVTASKVDKSNNNETNRANRSSNNNESLMEHDSKNDSTTHDKHSMKQTPDSGMKLMNEAVGTPTSQEDQSESQTIISQKTKPVSSSDISSDLTTRGMDKQEVANATGGEQSQEHQAETDRQAQGSSATAPTTSISNPTTGQLTPSNAQGTGGGSTDGSESGSVDDTAQEMQSAQK